MTLKRLEIARFRNLQFASVLLHPHINVFFGLNGSGKSSILEAVFVLSRGRSFRPGRARRLINDESSDFTVFVTLEGLSKAGIRRSANGDTELRLNEKPQTSLSELSTALPVALLDPASGELFDEGSKPRRAQLDWGLFHVEQSFYSVWLRYQRALKQRNSLLRSGSISPMERGVWDRELSEAAKEIHLLRGGFVHQWQPEFDRIANIFLPGISLALEYVPGWDVGQDIVAALLQQWNSDRERGFTQIGPHRADLRLKANGVLASEVLSRGQRKLLVCALKLSQLELLRVAGRNRVLLIDDLPSELDSESQSRLLDYISSSSMQVLITAINYESMTRPLIDKEIGFKLFHVEQGAVREI